MAGEGEFKSWAEFRERSWRGRGVTREFRNGWEWGWVIREIRSGSGGEGMESGR